MCPAAIASSRIRRTTSGYTSAVSVLKTTKIDPMRYGDRSAQRSRPSLVFTSPLEPQDDPDLRILRVIEGAVIRRAEIGLHVDGEERIERVPYADAQPRTEPQDLHVAFEAGF